MDSGRPDLRSKEYGWIKSRLEKPVRRATHSPLDGFVFSLNVAAGTLTGGDANGRCSSASSVNIKFR